MKAITDAIEHLLQSQTAAVAVYAILFAIIFAETGLLIGFFLPGDSLLFIAGALAATSTGAQINVWVMIPLLIVAAVAGDAVGYFLGRRFGPGLFSRPDSKLFKRDHLLKTQAFYDKHGSKTIVMARFVPIVRTFAPTVAGAAGMEYRKFALFNVLGGVGWISSMLLLGYFLGTRPGVKENIDKWAIGIVLLSVLPMVIHALLERRHNKDAQARSKAETAGR